jgi:hypothetical protein
MNTTQTAYSKAATLSDRINDTTDVHGVCARTIELKTGAVMVKLTSAKPGAFGAFEYHGRVEYSDSMATVIELLTERAHEALSVLGA